MKNNKSRGNTWERTIVKYLKELGYEGINTCRAESKLRDNQKVDICSLPGWNIQAKTLHTPVHPEKILSVMPEEDAVNVIFFKKTKKMGKRFMPEGEYAILNLADFLEIMKSIDEKTNSTH
jgi:hypothetical protein